MVRKNAVDVNIRFAEWLVNAILLRTTLLLFYENRQICCCIFDFDGKDILGTGAYVVADKQGRHEFFKFRVCYCWCDTG